MEVAHPESSWKHWSRKLWTTFTRNILKSTEHSQQNQTRQNLFKRTNPNKIGLWFCLRVHISLHQLILRNHALRQYPCHSDNAEATISDLSHAKLDQESSCESERAYRALHLVQEQGDSLSETILFSFNVSNIGIIVSDLDHRVLKMFLWNILLEEKCNKALWWVKIVNSRPWRHLLEFLKLKTMSKTFFSITLYRRFVSISSGNPYEFFSTLHQTCITHKYWGASENFNRQNPNGNTCWT